MINEKETLKKWHELDPNLTTDQLLQLLDGIVEKIEYAPYNPTTITYKENTTPNYTRIPDYTITCKQ